MREIKPIPLKKLAKGLSTMDRIRYGILYLRINKSEVLEMKEILKKESKRIIAELGEPKIAIVRAMEQYLEEYVDHLSKRDTFRLYMAYLEVKEAVDTAQTQYAKFEFLAKMYQTYMKEGGPNKSAKELKEVIKKSPAANKVRKFVRNASKNFKGAGKKSSAKKKSPRKKKR